MKIKLSIQQQQITNSIRHNNVQHVLDIYQIVAYYNYIRAGNTTLVCTTII